jgi:hypothetical protein
MRAPRRVVTKFTLLDQWLRHIARFPAADFRPTPKNRRPRSPRGPVVKLDKRIQTSKFLPFGINQCEVDRRFSPFELVAAAHRRHVQSRCLTPWTCARLRALVERFYVDRSDVGGCEFDFDDTIELANEGGPTLVEPDQIEEMFDVVLEEQNLLRISNESQS